MQALRTLGFFLKGRSNWTHEPFLSKAKHFNPDDLKVDLTGQHVIVTGANAGLGFETTKELATRGASVHMLCRNRQRGEEALRKLAEETGSSNLTLHVVDMSSMRDVQQFSQEYLQSGSPLHVLVHNAGCMIKPLTMTTEKLEVNFACNLAGPVLMTEHLLPLLRRTPESRVIFVSSGGMYTQPLIVNDLFGEKMSPFDDTAQYARNKRAQIALCDLYSVQEANRGVKFFGMHPGWADTEAVRTAMPGFYDKMKSSLRTPQEGADSIVWLACSRAAGALPSGVFVCDREVQDKHLTLAGTSYTMREVEALHARLRELLAPYWPAESGAAGPAPAATL